MIPKECKRLAEVDFPIAVVSKHAAREKTIRYGHPSTLHLWWARRPLASCRAMLMALLLPDPCDPNCPPEFKKKAREWLLKTRGHIDGDDIGLRQALLRFIGDFANWDLSADAAYLEVARGVVQAAHPEEMPLVVDPFAGGGAIPLEALRLGCDAFASDLNPVACLILKVMLEDIPRRGPQLADELRRVGPEIKKAAEKVLAEFYPPDPDGTVSIAYLWARTVRCESPNCGAEIPLARSFWLSKKANRKRALRYKAVCVKGETPHVEFQVFEPTNEREVPNGTVSRAKAACPCCNAVLSPDRVRAQLAAQRGGADVVFDKNGNRTGGARLLAVVALKPGQPGRCYRLPTEADYHGIVRALYWLNCLAAEAKPGALSSVPDEATPAGGGSGAGRAFSIQNYGMMQWGDLFTARQKTALAGIIAQIDPAGDLARPLALAVSRVAERLSSLARWDNSSKMETVAGTFGRQALPIIWDFAEQNPFQEIGGNWQGAVDWIERVVRKWAPSAAGEVQIADACESPLPDDAAAVWFTDPPYYDAIPYSDLSDFFLVWLKRVLPNNPLLRDPFDAANPLSPKVREAVQDETKQFNGLPKDRHFFEQAMARAFSEGRRILRADGVGSVVFAHKTTEGWEALLSGLIRGGWVITGSWPISTEMGSRLRARESAALATSVHLVCRPRGESAAIGDWGDVLRELPGRVGDWMERLQAEGVRGADLVFACIGPALEIYSRYSKVVDPQEREIPLGGNPEAKEPHQRGFLAYVWEVVGRTALQQVLGTAEARARNGAAGAVEEDARLTALFLWTIQGTASNGETNGGEDASDEEGEPHDEEDQATPPKTSKGFSLIYDVVRRFAQPLGIRLEEWEGRVIETEKGIVRLIPVLERGSQLFGEAGASLTADRIEAQAKRTPQATFDFMVAESAVPQIKGRGKHKSPTEAVSDKSLKSHRAATTLDRVHAAMLLQASGRANALRALLKSEIDRGHDFLRLSNALSALYPPGSDEKRLLDAMLLAVPR